MAHDPSAGGTYAPRVIMVAEHNPDRSVFDRALVHELVHAYDQQRRGVAKKTRPGDGAAAPRRGRGRGGAATRRGRGGAAPNPRRGPLGDRVHRRRRDDAPARRCRAKIDWKEASHHACAEIRASSLSGECDLSQEINRGRWGLAGHHGACVRRRAALSLALAGRPDPEAAVASVFDRCYRDTAPFDRHPDF